MKKTHFFSGESIEALQLNINTWLSEHKNISILRTGMESAAAKAHIVYSFYILYEDTAAEEATAVAGSIEQALPGNVVLPTDPGLQLQ